METGEINKSSTLAAAYDEIAEDLHLYPEYYEWVTDILGPARDAEKSIADIGCGAGALIDRLHSIGFRKITGVDFSRRCVEISQQRVPSATCYVHDIERAPLPISQDIIVMTEVVEHLSRPQEGLNNVYGSLSDGGTLILTFPNRWGFFPWYHLRFIGAGLRWWPWLQRWFLWFTTPYEMRTAQPIDHAYSVLDVRKFILDAGFLIIETRGYRLFPMLRISGIPITERLVEAFETLVRRLSLPVKVLHYRYMFICRKP